MDPLTAAGAFATIVGLLCNFKAERAGKNLDQFIAWLEEKSHEDIAASVRNNQELAAQLTTILSINHVELLEKLNRLDLLMSSIVGKVEAFSGLAKAIHPQLLLSDQAVSILRQLVSSGAKMFMENKIMTGSPDEYILMDGGTGRIIYEESQFMEDDLKTLVEIGLLHLDYGSKGSKGSRKFYVTREASRLIQEIDR